MEATTTRTTQQGDTPMAAQTLPASEQLNGKRPTGLRTNQPVNTHADLLDVTDGLL